MSWSADRNLSGKSVLLTGVTGYVGQIVLQKLVMASPGIGKIFVLIRPNRLLTSQQRFDKLIRESMLFIEPHARLVSCKVHVLSGELSMPNLGLDLSDLELCRRSISLVIHSAANVSFTVPFKDSIKSNLLGTQHIIDFILSFTSKPCLCYVSTAYVSAHLRNTTTLHKAEIVSLPPTVDAVRLCEMDDAYITHCEQTMMATGWPNTYTMSKVLAEDLIQRQRDKFKIIIVRPSMVAHIAKDLPALPGFNLGVTAGPSVCTQAVGAGALTICPAAVGGNRLDLVPADYVANAVVCASAYLLGEECSSFDIVYAVMGRYSVDVEDFMKYCVQYFRAHPVKGRLRTPRVYMCHGEKEFEFHVEMRYRIPLKVFSSMKKMSRMDWKPLDTAIKVMEKVIFLVDLVKWVVSCEFVFDDDGRCDALFEGLVGTERSVLWNDLHTLEHSQYVLDFCEGVDRMMRDNVSKL